MLPVPTVIAMPAPTLPAQTQAVIAQTALPQFLEASAAGVRQFGSGSSVTSWLAANSTLVMIGAGTLVALTLLKGRR